MKKPARFGAGSRAGQLSARTIVAEHENGHGRDAPTPMDGMQRAGKLVPGRTQEIPQRDSEGEGQQTTVPDDQDKRLTAPRLRRWAIRVVGVVLVRWFDHA